MKASRAPDGTAYRRVVSEEVSSDDEPEMTEEERIKHMQMLKLKQQAQDRKYVRQKAEALVWMALAAVLLWYGDKKQNFFSMLLHNVNLNRKYLYTAYALLAYNTCIFLYLAVWVTHVRKREDWEVYVPWAIPMATAVGLLMCLMFMFALWPIYGLLTPVAEFILFMGMLLSAHFLPGAKKASFNDSKSKITYYPQKDDD